MSIGYYSLLLIIWNFSNIDGRSSGGYPNTILRSFPIDDNHKSIIHETLSSNPSCSFLKERRSDAVATDFICNERHAHIVKSLFENIGIETKILIHDVEELARSHKARNELSRNSETTVNDGSQMDFTRFPRYEKDIVPHLIHLNKTCDAIEVQIRGKSHENRNLYLVKIGDKDSWDENKPVVFIDSGIHAREWGATSTGFFVVDKLAELFCNSDSDNSDVRRDVNWLIMPLLNPDGYEFTHEPGNRLWRKNRSPPPEGSTCYGIDLNRNWGCKGFGVGASLENPCSDVYAGKGPDSEPEVLAAEGVLLEYKHSIQHYIGLHTYGKYILTSWGFTDVPPEDNERLLDIGKQMAKAIKEVNDRDYTVGAAGKIFYAAGGASDDYSKLIAKIPTAMTIELPDDGDTAFIMDPSDIINVGNEIWNSLKVAAKIAKENPIAH